MQRSLGPATAPGRLTRASGRREILVSNNTAPGGSSAPPAPGASADRWRQGARDVAARAYRGENSGLLLVVMIVTVVVFGILLRDNVVPGREQPC